MDPEDCLTQYRLTGHERCREHHRMFKLAILPLRFPSPGVLTSPVHGLVRRDQARARQSAKQSDTLILEATFNVTVTNSGGNYVAKVVAGRLVAPRLIVGRINLVQALHSLKHAFLDSLN